MGDTVTGEALLMRLDAEEGSVRETLERLRDEVARLEERLAHLTITRQTVQTLLSDTTTGPPPGAAPTRPRSKQLPPAVTENEALTEEAPAGTPRMDRAGRLSEQKTTSRAESHSLGPVSSRIVTLVSTADRPLRAKEVTLALGRVNPKRTQVEGIRAALERLAGEGRLRKVGPGLYSGVCAETEGGA